MADENMQGRARGAQRAGDDDIRPSVPPAREVSVARAPDAAWDALPPQPEPSRDRVRWSLFPFLLQAALAVFFVWLYCQLLPAFRWVMSCEGWRFYAALGAVLVPVLVLAWVLLRALLLFRRLPPIAQLAEGEMDGLALKCRIQKRYLAKIPPTRDYVARCGFKEPGRVCGLLDSLRGEASLHSDEVGWLDEFRQFQSLQDARAKEIVSSCCKLVALKTAASPWRMLDMFCVFYNSTRMVCELAVVYNRRMSRGSAFRLVCRWCAAIYVSGELGSIMESTARKGGEYAADWLGDGDLMAGLAQSMPVLAKIAGKAIEGGVNAYFAYRMGRRAIESFRVLAPRLKGWE